MIGLSVRLTLDFQLGHIQDVWELGVRRLQLEEIEERTWKEVPHNRKQADFTLNGVLG